jgi:hypothetical protein
MQIQLPINGQSIDLTQFVTAATDQLLNAYSGLLVGTVQPWLLPGLIAGIAIAGMYWLFDFPHRAMQYLWRTILAYAVVTWLLRFYAAPMPLIGIPFSQIFRMESRWLSGTIDIGVLNVFLQNVSTIFHGQNKPHPWQIFAVIGYYLVLVSMALPELILFIETTFSIIALAMGALLGPIFIALYVLPFAWCKQLFWAWFHAMVKYSLYRVFASALVFIWATAEMNFLTLLFGGQYTLSTGIATLFVLLVFNVGCYVVCLRLSRIVSDFTTGGASAGGLAGSVGSAIYTAYRFI